ncbi:MAG: hypothetical protein ACJAS1_005890 [Oleiphilaceae bacterium]|jgi:hypothetical protein
MKIPTQINKILVTTILSISALNSQAAIIDLDTYFTDTVSGLSWLDVTATVNRSFDDISSQLVTGGQFDGWRYATGSEFNSLLSSWTGVAPVLSDRTITTGTAPSVDGLVTLFGSTLDSDYIARFNVTFDNIIGQPEGQGLDYTIGILADFFQNDQSQRQVAAIWDNESDSSAIDFYNAQHRQSGIYDKRGETGSYLVRSGFSPSGNSGASEVTEPKTILLFSLGLVGIFLSRRKKSA